MTIQIVQTGLIKGGAPLQIGESYTLDDITEAYYVSTGKAIKIDNAISVIDYPTNATEGQFNTQTLSPSTINRRLPSPQSPLWAATNPILFSRTPRIAVVGDSYVMQNGSATGYYATGPATFGGNLSLLNALAGQPWRFDPTLDQFGEAGGGVYNMMSQLAAIIARNPDVLVIQCGHNDFINFGATFFDSEKVLFDLFVSSIRAAGIIPIIVLEYPSQTQVILNGTNAQLVQITHAFNHWKRAYASNRNLLVWDWYTPLVDPTSSTGGILAANTTDGIHANYIGNLLIAQQGLLDLAPLLGQKTRALMFSQDDVYDPVYNPLGNLLAATDSLFLTNTSAVNGWSGVRPTNWNTFFGISDTGKVCTGSIVAPSDNIGEWFNIALSGTSSNGSSADYVYMYHGNFTSGLTAGTQIEAWIEFSVAVSSPFYAITAQLKDTVNNKSTGGLEVISPGNGNIGPSTAYAGVIYVPPFTLLSNSSLRMELDCYYNDSAFNFAGNVQFRRATARIASSP